MKLYRTPTGHWAGNQDDARALAKDLNTTWEPCEVPDNKAGLLAFLNKYSVGAESFDTPEVHTPKVEPVAQTPALVHPAQKQWDRLAMEEAILVAPLDTAVALAELVMSRIRDFCKER